MAQIKPLPEALQKNANEELGEVPERIPQDLAAFKAWIKQQPHLRARTDDQFLIQFLRGCKYSLEKAKRKIDLFYAYKTKYPELFVVSDVDSAQFRKLHSTGFYALLPKPLHENGARIAVVRLNFSSQEFNTIEAMRYCEAMLEIMLMNDPYACINGLVAVMDLSAATTTHLMQVSINVAKQFGDFYEKALPIRLKTLIFINISKHVHHILKMLLPCLPEKLKSRIVICDTNFENLEKSLPRQYLPIENGGENGSIDQWHIENGKLWDENRDFFKENVQYGTDEHLRIGKNPYFNDDLGIEGTFRKLDVD